MGHITSFGPADLHSERREGGERKETETEKQRGGGLVVWRMDTDDARLVRPHMGISGPSL